MHKNTPSAMHAEPYNKPDVNAFFDSKIKAVKMAKKPKMNNVTAATRLRLSFKIPLLPLMAKAIIKEPPNSNKIDRINCNHIYFVNKLFIWISSSNTIIVFAKGN